MLQLLLLLLLTAASPGLSEHTSAATDCNVLPETQNWLPTRPAAGRRLSCLGTY